ncbi:hepatic triacylglycerol lipase isoform X1 [Corythoichthys intestinalis]|uniref:hepatic triacylglycerol lipase isoform X1 n=2 Tax=Corythoichthys intestinalis TaxID=161448 RepID=UPI0025A4E198|nr:hepatic triacylglycerol lipase isoform X1 [Corythoichthys intestinalis]
MSALKVLRCLLLICYATDGRMSKSNVAALPEEQWGPPGKKALPVDVSSTVFRLFLTTAGEDTCVLKPRQLHGLSSCSFNATNPLIIITHGWSVDGTMENWVTRLASILKAHLKDVNVVITDWLSLAHQNYPKAARSTRTVGKDIAHLLMSLKEQYEYSFRKVHLIGYSLGAHISGFAGSYLREPEQIGRITGLDPAGPLFEGTSRADRLSPDDAEFVDAVHTFTHERLGLSVGIKRAVAHYDFYPNGGDFQPGCDNIYEHISQYGLLGFGQTVKCAHERSVHLFIDSMLNKDRPMQAYRCNDKQAFDRGVCVDCRGHRCNTLGYDIKKVRTGRRDNRLYLKTRSAPPYKLYHYQLRIQFVQSIENTKPPLSISLTGTDEESAALPIAFTEEVLGNKTYTFLITLEKHLGDLMLLKFHWEGWDLLKSMWKRVQTIMPWGRQHTKPRLTVGRISVKDGYTQQRTYFCAMTNDHQHWEMSKVKVFVRCQQDPRKQQHRRRKHT